MNLQVQDDAEAVARAGARLVAAAIQGGARTLVLAGGSTPARCYQILAEAPVSWGRVTILFGDERCVPPEHPESNYLMARRSLLDRVQPATVHRMAAELGAEEAAAAYAQVVGGLAPLDLVLLGMGPDGHTASLFPGSPALQSEASVVAVHGAPKPPPDRVSLGLETLRGAGRTVFLITGGDKSEALARAERGEVPAGLIPSAEYLVDRAAAGELGSV
ncbi:MAG: 6-phosphogluconolactonase [Candidatus Dormibacteraeota bacterium]|nr:6-phosphogluconolactonase [Candidatus Dormibacteraeota bacterium]